MFQVVVFLMFFRSKKELAMYMIVHRFFLVFGKKSGTNDVLQAFIPEVDVLVYSRIFIDL